MSGYNVSVYKPTRSAVQVSRSVWSKGRRPLGSVLRLSGIEQEAQLPQRNSASAAHMEGGWG